MTTIVGKGAGRPAAAARTAKHAQRNPQPRSHTTEIINDHVQSAPDSDSAMAAALDGTAYGRMSVDELKGRAKALLVKPLPRSKGALLNAILEAERADNQPVKAAGQDIDTVGAMTLPESDTNDGQGEISNADEEHNEPATMAATVTELDSKGVVKAGKLQAALAPYGWGEAVLDGEGNRVTAVLGRGDELLTVAWHGGVYSYEESSHLMADRTTRLRNVSAAVKLGARSAEAAQAEYNKVVSNRRFRPVQAKEAKLKGAPKAATARLFPAPGEVTEDELFAALAGYRVIWVNRITNITESATVSQNATFFRLKTNPAGEPFVTFCSDQGFRACRVGDIISTSRRSGRARRTKTLPGGEEVRAA